MSAVVKPGRKVCASCILVGLLRSHRRRCGWTGTVSGWRVAHELPRRALGGWVRAPQEARGGWGAIDRSRGAAPARGQLGGVGLAASGAEQGGRMLADVSLRAKAGTHRGCLAPPFIRVGVREPHHRAPDSLFAMSADPTRTNAPSSGRLAGGEPGASTERFVHISFSITLDPSRGLLHHRFQSLS